jgi:hypothetical protein
LFLVTHGHSNSNSISRFNHLSLTTCIRKITTVQNFSHCQVVLLNSIFAPFLTILISYFIITLFSLSSHFAPSLQINRSKITT